MSVIGSNGGAPELPPVDPGNPLLKPTEASFISAVSTLTDGTPVVIITVRTSSMTATVFLRRDDALEWARLLRNTARQVSPLLLPPGAAQ